MLLLDVFSKLFYFCTNTESLSETFTTFGGDWDTIFEFALDDTGSCMLFADAYGDVKFRLPTRLLVDLVTVAPTFVKYDALPLPTYLKPNVSAEGLFAY